MNRNKRAIQAASLALAATMMVGAASIPVSAGSATAGVEKAVVASTSASKTGTSFAGVSKSVAKIVATAKTEVAETELAVTAAAEAQAEAQAEAEAAQPIIGIAKVEEYVNVRSAADENSDPVGKLYSNNACTIYGEENGWYSITSGNITGYVKSDFITTDQAEVAANSYRTATVHADTLYIRKETSTESEVLDAVSDGTYLSVIDESTADQGWVKVDKNGTVGFVSTEFITIDTKYTVGETLEEEAARIREENVKKLAKAIEANKAAERAAARQASRSSSSSSASASSGSSSKSSRSYSAPSGGSGQDVVNYACQFVGNPYVYGGSSLTNGTDCSGFVMSVYGAFGVSLPHSSSADRGVGYGVSVDEMQPGDIVCYSGHVAIYAGNGTIVHASNPRTGITYGNVNYRNILAVRRVF